MIHCRLREQNLVGDIAWDYWESEEVDLIV